MAFDGGRSGRAPGRPGDRVRDCRRSRFPTERRADAGGFTKFLVYMAEPLAGEPLLGDPEAFQREVMGRSTEEIEADKAAAEEFFLRRFGVDFTSTSSELFGEEEIEEATFGPFAVSDAFNYRAYVISGEHVPAKGWQVRDGGWMVTMTEDTVLHGEYGGTEGKAVSAGTVFVFGNYNIKVQRPKSGAPPHAEETIVIHYESGGPIVADADGVTSFICDLTHPEWGAGQARGIVSPNGEVRNVLTFPPGLP
jgi:hypothetical protein